MPTRASLTWIVQECWNVRPDTAVHGAPCCYALIESLDEIVRGIEGGTKEACERFGGRLLGPHEDKVGDAMHVSVQLSPSKRTARREELMSHEGRAVQSMPIFNTRARSA